VTKQILPIVVALVIGIAVGGWLFGGGDSSTLPPLQDVGEMGSVRARDFGESAPATELLASLPEQGDTVAVIRQLISTLEGEQQARDRMDSRISALERQLGNIERKLEQLGDLTDPEALATAALLESIEESAAQQPMTAEERSLRRFVEAGFSPGRARELKAREDKVALDRLFLRDQARREGWMGSERYREELASINSEFDDLRAELGDDDYDRYLYASGRPNRVIVRDTLTGGPGAQAGLLPGDAILSYNGERVFNSRMLSRTTQEGTFGESVTVEVDRKGERLVLYIPRGPLGVDMRSSTRKPDG
jgi:hypothetical protein